MKEKLFIKTIHQLNFAGAERAELFLKLDFTDQPSILLNLSRHVQLIIMNALADQDLVNILNRLDPDEVTDLIQILTVDRRNQILDKLKNELKKTVKILKEFDPHSAAGLMNLDYIQLDINDKIIKTLKLFREHEKRTGRLPVIYITDHGQLKGYLPGHELGFARPFDRVKKYVRQISTVKYNATQDEVVHLFRTHSQNKIAVLDDHENVIGVIYSDDILKALKEEESSDLYDFAGVNEEENVMDSVAQKVKHRYKWLIINLGTAFLAAFTVSLFDNTISKYVLLAVYMPIVAGMGGNAGTQTLAVLVRGIAFKQIDFKTAWPTLKRELLAGIINGFINGLLVAGVIILFNRNLKIAIVLGLAMIVNLFVAGLFGTLVPLFMKKIGKDPATSATIFITTATDVLGFLVFLGLATMILK